MPGASYSTLLEIAADQFGLVTTAQAKAAGVSPQTLLMMSRRGTAQRVSRSVYRLTQFPASELDVLMESVLWPGDPGAVLSHESALRIYELGTSSPTQIHVTVPARFRTRRAVPKQLVLHPRSLPTSDVLTYRGLPVTTPLRTIIDCRAAKLGEELIQEAIIEAEARGLISVDEVASLGEEG